MKKPPLLSLFLPLLLSLGACGARHQEQAELHIFAAVSMTETINQIIADYKTQSPDVIIVPTYDSSGTLLTQIQEGAD